MAREKDSALKGSTAINLFVRDFPRFSIDMDVTYLPLDSRETALKNIQESLERIRNSIEKAIPGLKVTPVSSNDGTEVKLNCQYRNAQIKIEVNTTTRGHVFPARLMQVSDSVQKEFGKFAAINIVSHAELFGGKICAALDRQHPRDLFDVKLLLENEGFTDDIKQGVIISLLSHYKPIHELLNPILKDQRSAIETQFAGMTSMAFTYDDYDEVRSRLITILQRKLTKADKDLIYSFESGNPEWELFPHKALQELPAVQWKLQNIAKLKTSNPRKHKQMMKALMEILS